MLYAGLVWLHLTEEQFWKLTPRKLFVLLRVHRRMNQASDSTEQGTPTNADTVCIDQVKGW